MDIRQNGNQANSKMVIYRNFELLIIEFSCVDGVGGRNFVIKFSLCFSLSVALIFTRISQMPSLRLFLIFHFYTPRQFYS